MRLVSYSVGGDQSFGVVTDTGIIDLKQHLPDTSTMRALIASWHLPKTKMAVRTAAGQAGVDYAIRDVMLLPPVTNPEKIWCIGVNYPDRNAEYRDLSEQPKYPSLFARSISSLVGHETPLERPHASEQLDYEGEIALIIGLGGRHIAKETALDHIFGITLCNEGTVRDWLRHGKFNVTQGKNFDRSGSLGPWIVTADSIDLRKPITLTTRVNGEIRQHDSTDRLIFSFAELLVYLSTFATLCPGDVIVTGTPTGAGVRLDPPKWLKPHDVVEVEAPPIGVLRNRVADEG